MRPALRPGQADLWRLSLAVGEARLAALAATLVPDERARAAALYTPQLRARFAAGRGLLRETLARYVAASPGALQLCAGAYGKPALSREPPAGLRFNLSHCEDLLLIVVARGHEVGVDVERARPVLGMGQIVASLLSAEEREELGRAAPEERDWSFARLWTRREALAKGEGGGLAHAPATCRDWSLFELRPEPGYAASLALEGVGWRALPSPTANAGPWASFTLTA